MSEEVDERWLRVELSAQRLFLLAGGSLADNDRAAQVLAEWSVSTARNGPGERQGSGCTPRGRHRIRLCIGAGCVENTVFVARRPTGEIYSPELARAHPQRDWILTRILWLSGTQSGLNRGGAVDSLRRFIYIHGTPDTEPMEEPRSHGCIRMRNRDLLVLFDQVRAGMPVLITPLPGHWRPEGTGA